MSLPLNHAAEFSALLATQCRKELGAAIHNEALRAQSLQVESDRLYAMNQLTDGARVGLQALDAFESVARLARKLESCAS